MTEMALFSVINWPCFHLTKTEQNCAESESNPKTGSLTVPRCAHVSSSYYWQCALERFYAYDDRRFQPSGY